jgi:hypothetical protein
MSFIGGNLAPHADTNTATAATATTATNAATALAALNEVAAAQASGPQALFAALDAASARTIGHTLFTILSYDRVTRESARIYSNMPVHYPTGAKKPLAGGPWVDIVLERGEVYIGHTHDDLQRVFADHQLLASLGCESVLNVPVRWRGATLASLNLLHTAHWYRDSPLPLACAFAQYTLPALLDTHID